VAARVAWDATWWQGDRRLVALLERGVRYQDPTLKRLTQNELRQIRRMRVLASDCGIDDPGDLLAYQALADGPFGRYRIVAAFPAEPEWSGAAPPFESRPRVFSLDGPTGTAASQHRIDAQELCLYYPWDPPERRWRPENGLFALLTLARRHLYCEFICRRERVWPVEEAPHGETTPARRDPSLAVPSLHSVGRNDRCWCGSGIKAKRCCFR
jgi:hypothetical protein